MATATIADHAEAARDDSDTRSGTDESGRLKRLSPILVRSVLGPVNAKIASALLRFVRSLIARFKRSSAASGDGSPGARQPKRAKRRPVSATQLARESQSETRASRRPLLVSAVIVAVLAIGAVAFKLLRTPAAPPVAPAPPRLAPVSGTVEGALVERKSGGEPGTAAAAPGTVANPISGDSVDPDLSTGAPESGSSNDSPPSSEKKFTTLAFGEDSDKRVEH